MVLEVLIICVSALAGYGMFLYNRHGKWSEVNAKLISLEDKLESLSEDSKSLSDRIDIQKSRIDEITQRENRKALKGLL